MLSPFLLTASRLFWIFPLAITQRWWFENHVWYLAVRPQSFIIDDDFIRKFIHFVLKWNDEFHLQHQFWVGSDREHISRHLLRESPHFWRLECRFRLYSFYASASFSVKFCKVLQTFDDIRPFFYNLVALNFSLIFHYESFKWVLFLCSIQSLNLIQSK